MTTTPPVQTNRGQAIAGLVLLVLGALLLVVGVALFLGPGAGLIPLILGLVLAAGGSALRFASRG